MERKILWETERIYFSEWLESDLNLAKSLWGNVRVTKYICAAGVFSDEEIFSRLKLEISNQNKFGISYWPIFMKDSNTFIGCCGLRPHAEGEYEIGFHILPDFWGKGIAKEAADAVINYAFRKLSANSIFAGHNPQNSFSKKRLLSLGFRYIKDEFYPPTGLNHPSYILLANRNESE